MVRLAIFASGNGTNAERIIEYFAHNSEVCVSCVAYNKRDAFVAERARRHGVDAVFFGREDFYESERVCSYLVERHIDWVILAGFLWLVPQHIVHTFSGKIINIHPALLPKYGGKGMYGHHVHEAVVENHEKESGITIHLVDEQYDNGRYLFQAVCPVAPNDTPEMLAEKVHQLEYEHFPHVIEQTVLSCE